jgi:uncharacterized lipoprotein YehR (DUF1307 family)
MKKMLKLLGVIALAAVVVFSMAACGDDSGGGGGGGGLNWDGVYKNSDNEMTTVNFSAGTITGYYDTSYEWNGTGVISNVTLGEVKKEKDQYWTKDWAYLFIETDKIGYIFKAVHSNAGSFGYTIIIGPSSSLSGVLPSNLELDDLVDKGYRVNAEKD